MSIIPIHKNILFADGTVLIHTTMGDLLRRLESENSHSFPDKEVNLLLVSRECILLVLHGRDNLVTFTTSGRELSCLRYFRCIVYLFNE